MILQIRFKLYLKVIIALMHLLQVVIRGEIMMSFTTIQYCTGYNAKYIADVALLN